jgi:hypothetical protein
VAFHRRNHRGLTIGNGTLEGIYPLLVFLSWVSISARAPRTVMSGASFLLLSIKNRRIFIPMKPDPRVLPPANKVAAIERRIAECTDPAALPTLEKNLKEAKAALAKTQPEASHHAKKHHGD